MYEFIILRICLTEIDLCNNHSSPTDVKLINFIEFWNLEHKTFLFCDFESLTKTVTNTANVHFLSFGFTIVACWTVMWIPVNKICITHDWVVFVNPSSFRFFSFRFFSFRIFCTGFLAFLVVMSLLGSLACFSYI